MFMRSMTYLFITLFVLGFSSPVVIASSGNAGGSSCQELIARVLEPSYKKRIQQALQDKELVHRSHNSLTVRKPGARLFTRLLQRSQRFFSQVINDNRFPSYYVFNEEQTAPKIMAYVRTLTESPEQKADRLRQSGGSGSNTDRSTPPPRSRDNGERLGLDDLKDNRGGQEPARRSLLPLRRSENSGDRQASRVTREDSRGDTKSTSGVRQANSGDDKSAPTRNQDFGPEIKRWVDDYESYQKQLDDLVKARVSMAYNLELLKRYQGEARSIDRVELSFYRNGDFETSVFTFREDDGNLRNLIRDLETKIKYFDGGFFTPSLRQNSRLGFEFSSEGMIRHRVLEQGRLRDKLTILHRELEFAWLNLERRAEFSQHTEEGKQQLQELLQRVERLLMDDDLKPSDWAQRRISAQKLRSEISQSLTSNKRLERIRERSDVISNYLSESEITRANLLSRGHSFFMRLAAFGTPGVMTISGLVTIFDLDETISDFYEKYLIWRYGDRIQCVKERTDNAYIDCLYRQYERDYPEIIQMALKNPNFDPWDFEKLRESRLFPSALLDAYQEDIEQMQRYREYYRYIRSRREEIKNLFADAHQTIIDGLDAEERDIAACIAVSDSHLPVCIFDSLLSKIAASFGKIDELMDVESFDPSNYEALPEELREEYIARYEEFLFQRDIYKDLENLESYELRMFFED